MNISESVDTVILLRVLQGLGKADGRPYSPDEVITAAEALAERATKTLKAKVVISQSAIGQTLEHLADPLTATETPPA